MKETILSGLLFLVSATLFAAAELTEEQHNRIYNANHRPSVRLAKERSMRQLSVIKEDEARSLVEKLCDEPIRKIRLTHRHRTLYYDIVTDHCHLVIDAMEGDITVKERK